MTERMPVIFKNGADRQDEFVYTSEGNSSIWLTVALHRMTGWDMVVEYYPPEDGFPETMIAHSYVIDPDGWTWCVHGKMDEANREMDYFRGVDGDVYHRTRIDREEALADIIKNDTIAQYTEENIESVIPHARRIFEGMEGFPTATQPAP